MTLRLLVDIEKLVIAYLLDVEDVTDIVGERVGSRKDPPYPRVTVTRLGGPTGSIPAHLDPARIQIEAWAPSPKDGGGKAQANLVARTVQAAMFELILAEHEDGVVTDVVCTAGPLWQPDPVTDVPRYILDFIVRVHPVSVS